MSVAISAPTNFTVQTLDNEPKCRFCSAPLDVSFVDLGMSPLCESYIREEQRNQMEPFYPLHVWVCRACLLVQLEEYVQPDHIFTEYAYFSSYADSWVEHARRYAEKMIDLLDLNAGSQVIELASNDGYLLQWFVRAGIPSLGVDPAANVARAAIEKGVPTRVLFFGRESATTLAAEGYSADLIAANNVLAHVPDLNSFVAGMKILLKPTGTITCEFPHLYRLIEGNQFDTIYHEHFCYFSLLAVEQVFAAHGMTIFDVEELSTHGGSLRIYARHREDVRRPVTQRLADLRTLEVEQGYREMETYGQFGERVKETKRKLLEFLIDIRRAGKTIVGYGAPGKGNTLLNYCGIRTDFLDYTVDRNPYKQGLYLPGTHIPVFHPDKIAETRPDYVLILPWNFKDEIVKQLAYIGEWGGKFVVPVPEALVMEPQHT